MGDLSNNFSRHEFTCKCGCGFDTVDTELIAVLQKLRDYFHRPIRINSGCRCEKHNAASGGVSGSQHTLGRAADIVVDGVPPEIVQYRADQIMKDHGGIIVYDNFVHIDTRSKKAYRGDTRKV